ncbi:MAG: DUF1992 domain-containing protein [Desulfovibrio sp.]|jgi:hypothetical protein|nr:DUF1992 domain-containing protein [Desulfovibrio sp.]
MTSVDLLTAIALVAEKKIEEAIAEGKFENIPGTGKPLVLEDLSHLPAEMRMAYTILRNSSHLEDKIPPGALARMDDLLAGAPEERRAYGKMRRLKLMLARVRKTEEKKSPDAASAADAPSSPYLEKLLEKI